MCLHRRGDTKSSAAIGIAPAGRHQAHDLQLGGRETGPAGRGTVARYREPAWRTRPLPRATVANLRRAALRPARRRLRPRAQRRARPSLRTTKATHRAHPFALRACSAAASRRNASGAFPSSSNTPANTSNALTASGSSPDSTSDCTAARAGRSARSARPRPRADDRIHRVGQREHDCALEALAHVACPGDVDLGLVELLRDDVRGNEVGHEHRGGIQHTLTDQRVEHRRLDLDRGERVAAYQAADRFEMAEHDQAETLARVLSQRGDRLTCALDRRVVVAGEHLDVRTHPARTGDGHRFADRNPVIERVAQCADAASSQRPCRQAADPTTVQCHDEKNRFPVSAASRYAASANSSASGQRSR